MWFSSLTISVFEKDGFAAGQVELDSVLTHNVAAPPRFPVAVYSFYILMKLCSCKNKKFSGVILIIMNYNPVCGHTRCDRQSCLCQQTVLMCLWKCCIHFIPSSGHSFDSPFENFIVIFNFPCTFSFWIALVDNWYSG